jgi:hypothetical protein
MVERVESILDKMILLEKKFCSCKNCTHEKQLQCIKEFKTYVLIALEEEERVYNAS